MRIIVSALDKGGDHELSHDLNFQQERYEAEHKIVSSTLGAMSMKSKSRPLIQSSSL